MNGLNQNQKVYGRFLVDLLSDMKSINRSISWIERHMNLLRYEHPDVYRAYRELSYEEINEVTCEVLLPF